MEKPTESNVLATERRPSPVKKDAEEAHAPRPLSAGLGAKVVVAAGRSFKWGLQHPRWVAVAAGLGAVATLWSCCSGGSKSGNVTFTVKHAPLSITVPEQGSIKAVDSQEVKCEVQSGRDPLRIIRIVKEGYQVIEADIREKKVLVELDSSEVKRQIVDQDIKCEQADAALSDAQGNYDIQENQNKSDIKAAEQKARFTRMDFDKFLGATITQGIIDQLGIEKPLLGNGSEEKAVESGAPATQVPNVTGTNASQPVTSGTQTPEKDKTPGQGTAERMLPPAPIDFSRYAKIELLGDGEAKQKLRKQLDDLQVAKKDEQKAITQLAGTRRLQEKDFVTKTELEKDDIDRQSAALKVQSAETSRDLFIKYEFQKTAEEVLSKYDEAIRELARSHKAAISKLAQVKGKLNSAKAQFGIESRKRDKLLDQLSKCTILATKQGLVVYGDGHSSPFRREEEIKEGSTVREQQTLITIPDMSKMCVSVKIHESYIKKVKTGQKARVVADAFPDSPLEGEVTSVGVLPDSEGSFFSSENKVYLTIVTIKDAHDWLKPGMTAKVEVMVNYLPDVTVVPVQTVFPWNGKQACYIAGRGKPERRMVEIGEFNDEFIEIKSGLKVGEQVVLRPDSQGAQEEAGKEQENASEKKPQTASATPTSPPGLKAR